MFDRGSELFHASVINQQAYTHYVYRPYFAEFTTACFYHFSSSMLLLHRPDPPPAEFQHNLITETQP